MGDITSTAILMYFIGISNLLLFDFISIICLRISSTPIGRKKNEFGLLLTIKDALKILQIDDLFKFKVAKFVYGSLNNKTPSTFRKYFL